ncbi:hypothetical protein GQF61_16765 [Sphingobacterium sp. DK4209]|uniref:Uncharacterized protein n=1 Tax=Sphingobacterium zhuxiongii TaxID=2662364 RepID=A0A5Q0Q4D5_9SPHI|nr:MULTISPECIES: hypothetical protein [unclassified Sphingobacterium]MVZ67506.1 hypothetical protein [Sphingobacterium sp. DK4209]QGA24905.1 hypothetical protein GFH32_00580 [Sphingobacterium sp. dk4302]
MDKQKIKYKGIIQRHWGDPVLSQLISVGLFALLTVFYSLCEKLLKDILFVQALKDGLIFKVGHYKILTFLALAVQKKTNW